MIRVFLPDLPGTRIPNFYPDMPIIKITSLSHPGVEIFSSLTEAQLRNRLEPTKGIFIAESPKVIRVALSAGYEPLALLCEPKHIEGDAADIIACHANLPIYTGEREILSQLTGYTLTRGVLCAFRRPVPPNVEEVCRNARRIVVIQGVTDTTNIGAIFRSAAALGMDAVLLTPDSCDPLNRLNWPSSWAPKEMDYRTTPLPMPTMWCEFPWHTV